MASMLVIESTAEICFDGWYRVSVRIDLGMHAHEASAQLSFERVAMQASTVLGYTVMRMTPFMSLWGE